MSLTKDSISIGHLESYPSKDNKRGAYIQINNLLVEVKISDDNQGYIIDVFNNDNEELLQSDTIWKDDLMEVKDEG